MRINLTLLIAAISCSLNAIGQGTIHCSQLSANTISVPAASQSIWANTGNDADAYALKDKQQYTGRHGGNSQLKVTNRESNFTSFTPSRKSNSNEVLQYNKGYESDPDLGELLPNVPCDNCFEVIEKRTQTQKYFIREGTNAKKFVLQSSSTPIHYKDKQGVWRNISDHLVNRGGGVLSTTGRPVNIQVNTTEGYMTLAGPGGNFTCNRNLELVYAAPDGTERSLGKANWSNYTTGDDGMQIKNAWPGIDIDIYVLINSAKTNFVVNTAMPEYANGKLLIRDHTKADDGLNFDQVADHGYTGALKLKNNYGEEVFRVQKALAYEKNNSIATMEPVTYGMGNDKTIDIEVPGNWFNRPATSYPVIVDPYVTTTVYASGFSYSSTLDSVYCTTTNYAAIPAYAYIDWTNITYSYYGVLGSYWSNSGIWLGINGGCKTSRLSCGGTPSGIPGATCGYSTYDYSATQSGRTCSPANECTGSSYTLPIELYQSQNFANNGDCESASFAPATSFQAEVNCTYYSTTSVSPSPSTICTSHGVIVTGSPAPGNYTSYHTGIATVDYTSGVVVGVSAGADTIAYTASGGEYCPSYAYITVQAPISVPSVTPSAPGLCLGNTVSFSDALGGGTWSSTNPSVATIDPSIGVLTGITTGATTISYSLSNVCGTYAATDVYSVNPFLSPGAITGSGYICLSGSGGIILSDTVTGGAWSSSDPSVATVDGSGNVTGIAAGSCTISYTVTNPACGSLSATKNVLVSISAPLAAAIIGAPSLCQGSSVVFTDAVTGGAWSSPSSIVSVNAHTGSVAGISAGTAIVSYAVINGCGAVYDTATVTVVPSYSIVPGTISTIAGTGVSGYTGDGGLATAAELSGDDGIAIDTSGNIYVAQNINTVRKISPAGIISTIAGNGTNGYSGDGGPASAAQLNQITSFALDASGNLFIADRSNYRIRRIDAISGTITTFAGNGTPGFSGDGGPATSAEFWWPSSVAFDNSGNTYITDEGAQRIRKVSPSGIITTIAGTGTAGYSGDGGSAAMANLNYPFSLAIDGSGNIYISDNGNNCIRKINTAGIISTYAGNGTAGYSGDGGSATSAELSGPLGIKLDAAGNLYIADGNNNVVRKVTTSGIITTIAGTGAAGSGGDGGAATAAQLNTDEAIALDASGNVYITDMGNNKIRKITYAAAQIGAITSADTICLGTTVTVTDSTTGGTWSSSNISIATISSIGAVTGLLAGTSTITYSINNNCGGGYVVKNITVAPAPTVAPFTGPSAVCQGGTIVLGETAPGGTWSSSAPGTAYVYAGGAVAGITVGTVTVSYMISNFCGTATGTLAVTVNPSYTSSTATSIITTIAGTGVSGTSGDGGPATAAELNLDNGVATDVFGNIYIVSNNNTIRKVTPDGIINTVAGTGVSGYSGDGGSGTSAQLNGVTAVAADPSGNLFIADRGNYRIRRLDAVTGIITTFCGNGTSGYSGDGGPASDAMLVGPSGITSDGLGNIYICDEVGQRIRKVNAAGIITTFAGTGTAGFSGDGGAATIAQFDYPYSIAADNGGNVYVSDYFNVRIRIINAAGIITTYAGNGIGGYVGDGGAAVLAEMSNPWGLALDRAGNLYIADGGNNVVRKVSTTGLIYTIAGTAAAGSSGDGGPATAASLNADQYVALDAIGNIYIADLDNNKVRKISAIPSTVVTAITGHTVACTGTPDTLTNPNPGGSWTSANVSIASVNSSGIISGITDGSTMITYTLSNMCASAVVTKTITVNTAPVPSAIILDAAVCTGYAIFLTDAAPGGVWSTSSSAVANIIGGGLFTAIGAGTVAVTYSVTNACGAASVSTVTSVYAYPSVGVITGSSALCIDSVTTLSDSVTDGTWSSSSADAVISTSGVVFGVSPGTVTISYKVTNSAGCTSTTSYPLTIEHCFPLAVSNSSGNDGIRVFPNPNNTGVFTVFAPSVADEPAKLEVSNMVGEKIKTLTISTNKDNELIFNEPAGIYFITVYTAQKTYVVKVVLTN